MSKSLWSRSVWNSLFNRVTGSRRSARQRRRSLRTNWKNGQPVEALEQRVVPAAVAVTYSAGVLTLVSTAGATNEVVAVKGGAAFTDVTVGGKLTSRLQGVAGNSIDTINFNGGGGTKDSLAVSGITDGVIVGLTDVDKLQLNITGTTTVTSSMSAVNDSNVLTLVTSTISGALEVDHNGAITQSGALIVSGITDIDVTGYDITLKTASNSFGNLVLDGANITVTESGPMNFGTTTATGILKATSTGAITQTGTVAVTGEAKLISNGGNIGTATVPFVGAFTDGLVLTGSVVNVSDTAGDTNLGKVNAASTLKVLSAGAITSTGAQTVAGLATYTAAAGSDITLDSSNNFGSLTLSGADVYVKEKSATDFTSVSATATFEVLSSGAITDSGTIIVGGVTTLTTKSNVILFDQAASTFGQDLILTGTTVSVTDSDGHTTLGAIIAKGNLNITTTTVTTGIDQDNATTSMVVTGRATFTAAGMDITLNSVNNYFGSIALFGKVVTVKEADATNLFTSTITDDLIVTSEGAVTDSGPLAVTNTTTITAGGATSLAITLDALSTFGDTINLDGSNAVLVNIDATDTDLGNITLTGSFNLDSLGDVEQSTTSTISVTGRATIEANGQDIGLGGSATGGNQIANFGSLALSTSGLGTATIREDSSTDLFDSTIGDDLEIDALGAVTDSGVLEIGGVTNIDADQGTSFDITLNSAGSTFEGSVLLDGNNLTLVNDIDTQIGATTADGTLLVVSNGTIIDIGAIAVTALATFNAQGDNITLNDAGLDLDGGVSLFGEDVTLIQTITQALNLATSTIGDDLILTVDGDITDSGNIVVDDVATISTEDPTSVLAQSIELNSARNAFGQLVLTVFNATINEIDETNLGLSTVNGFLTVSAVTGVTDSDTVSVTGNANLLASDGDILLDQPASAFGSLTLTADNISVSEAAAGAVAGTLLAGVSTGGTFKLTALGAVTQNAGISASGDATITASGQSITLTQVGDTVTNNFGTLTFTGAAVAIHESSPMSLSPNPAKASTATGNLTLHSTGSITAPVTGIVSSGETAITELKAGSSGTEVITLTNGSNSFGELRLQGGNVTINDNNTAANTTIIGESTVGSLTLTTDADVTRTADALAVTNLLKITVTGTNDVNLRAGGGTNNFGSINITADDVTITEASGTIISGLDLTGDLDLISGGNVSGITTNLDIDQTTTIVATGFDITLDATGSADSPTFGGKVSFTGKDITITANGALTLDDITATDDVELTASGTVTNDLGGGNFGTLLVTTGDTTIHAGTSAIAINIFASASNLQTFLVTDTSGTVTTTIPTSTISVNSITLDNVVNISEAAGSVLIKGMVSGTVPAAGSDIVTLTVNGVSTYTGTVTTFTSTGISVPGSGLTADADLKVEASVAVTSAVNYGIYTPTAANTSKSYTVDTTAPTVTLSGDALSAADIASAPGQDATITITFSETVTGFNFADFGVGFTVVAAGDVTFTAPVALDFTPVSGTTYTLVVHVLTGTANVANRLTINVGAGVAIDSVGNSNTAATTLVLTVGV